MGPLVHSIESVLGVTVGTEATELKYMALKWQRKAQFGQGQRVQKCTMALGTRDGRSRCLFSRVGEVEQ